MSLRKQEVADRLNAWLIFHQKNKELCDWLTQMENKVALSSDLNIEEMVEKLKKVKVPQRSFRNLLEPQGRSGPADVQMFVRLPPVQCWRWVEVPRGSGSRNCSPAGLEPVLLRFPCWFLEV